MKTIRTDIGHVRKKRVLALILTTTAITVSAVLFFARLWPWYLSGFLVLVLLPVELDHLLSLSSQSIQEGANGLKLTSHSVVIFGCSEADVKREISLCDIVTIRREGAVSLLFILSDRYEDRNKVRVNTAYPKPKEVSAFPSEVMATMKEKKSMG